MLGAIDNCAGKGNFKRFYAYGWWYAKGIKGAPGAAGSNVVKQVVAGMMEEEDIMADALKAELHEVIF